MSPFSQETVTHTFRVTTTSDIWVTESTFVELPVTVYTTDRDYVPEVPRTVTSVLKVTTTPVRAWFVAMYLGLVV